MPTIKIYNRERERELLHEGVRDMKGERDNREKKKLRGKHKSPPSINFKVIKLCSNCSRNKLKPEALILAKFEAQPLSAYGKTNGCVLTRDAGLQLFGLHSSKLVPYL